MSGNGSGGGAGRRGIPFVVAAPSGTGKTTVCRQVVARDPAIAFSISHTTRKPRAGEQDGLDYHFVSPARFRELIHADHFVEYAEYGPNLYGTSWASLERPIAEGRDLLVEIEVKGARQIRDRRRDARFVFLLPPDMETLGRRLRERGSDPEDVIELRLAIAEQELAAIDFFDYAVVNDDLEQAIVSVLEIIAAERDGDTEEARRRHGRAGVHRAWLAKGGAS